MINKLLLGALMATLAQVIEHVVAEALSRDDVSRDKARRARAPMQGAGEQTKPPVTAKRVRAALRRSGVRERRPVDRF